MCVFSSPSFDQHELVSFSHHAPSGLRAIIAVHNSNLGPAVGGCRMFAYTSDESALEDVLRLSRSMTYKSALAGLPMGGGKAVIIGDPETQKTPELLHAMGDFIQSQGGRYVTAEDSGTSVADMQTIAERTEFVSGVDAEQQFGGDPSPFTAEGVYLGIKAAWQHISGSKELKDVRVAVQGAGAVGLNLTQRLIESGAKVWIADVNQQRLDRAQKLGANVVGVEDIVDMDVDILAPCAMGGVINDQTIESLKARIVAGAANNQLARAEHADHLRAQGVLYAPDFVINAGGIIEIYHQRANTQDQAQAHIERISQTLHTIFKQSEQSNTSTLSVAEQLAENTFKNSALEIAAAYAVSNNA